MDTALAALAHPLKTMKKITGVLRQPDGCVDGRHTRLFRHFV